MGQGRQPAGRRAPVADGAIVRRKRAVIDRRLPETDPRPRMGIQAVRSPCAAPGGTTVMTGDAAAVTANWKAAGNVDVTACRRRPRIDSDEADDSRGSRFMDNMDVFGLAAPARLDGLKVTPRAMYAAIGPNTFRDASEYTADRVNGVVGRHFFSGRSPALRAASGIAKGSAPDSRAGAWRAGLAGVVTAFVPFPVAWGSPGAAFPGWRRVPQPPGGMAAPLPGYRLDRRAPGLCGWRTAGDDDDPGSGSEGVPRTVSDFGLSGFSSTLAGPAGNGLERDRVIGGTLAGAWGVGLGLRDRPFLAALTRPPRASLPGGISGHRVLRRVHVRTGAWMTPSAHSASPGIGRENLRVTGRGYARGRGLATRSGIGGNLRVNVDASCVRLFPDDAGGTGGQALTGGSRRDPREALNVSVLFICSFQRFRPDRRVPRVSSAPRAAPPGRIRLPPRRRGRLLRRAARAGKSESHRPRWGPRLPILRRGHAAPSRPRGPGEA